MDFKNKYLKYKEKYITLKNQLGGVKRVGLIEEPLIDKLIQSNVTVIEAHGGLDLHKWYVIPENTYILTTSEFGGITCSNFNNAFKSIINDKINRENLKSLIINSSSIKTLVDESNYFHKKTTYLFSDLYELYEPGDIIPQIDFTFYDTTPSNFIYSWLTYPEYDISNSNPVPFFNEYSEIFSSEKNFRIMPGASLNTIKFKEYMKKVSEIYSVDLLKNLLKKTQIDESYKEYFLGNMFDVSNSKYDIKKDFFAYNPKKIKKESEFILFIMTLYIKKYDKLEYDIKEIIDTLDKTKINVIVLTTCLYAKDIQNKLLKAHYTQIPKENFNLSKLEEHIGRPLESEEKLNYITLKNNDCEDKWNNFFPSPNYMNCYYKSREKYSYLHDVVDEELSNMQELEDLIQMENKEHKIKNKLENAVDHISVVNDTIIMSDILKPTLELNKIETLKNINANINYYLSPESVFAYTNYYISNTDTFKEFMKFRFNKNELFRMYLQTNNIEYCLLLISEGHIPKDLKIKDYYILDIIKTYLTYYEDRRWKATIPTFEALGYPSNGTIINKNDMNSIYYNSKYPNDDELFNKITF